MVRKNSEEVKEVQRIEDNGFLENFTFIPQFVTRWFVDNIITRSIAHLVAWSEAGAKRLLCTTAGILKVAPVGTGFEHNDTHAGNAPDAYGTAITFDSIASRVDIWIFDNDSIVKRSKDGITFDDEVEVPADLLYSVDCTTTSINIKNKTGGSVARYQIIGWY